MKKLNLINAFIGVTALAATSTAITSCSTNQNEVTSITVKLNSPVKPVGSTLKANDFTVTANYSDGTSAKLKYGEDGFDVSTYRVGHLFTANDIGTHYVCVEYKHFAEFAKLEITDNAVSATLVGSDIVDMDRSVAYPGEDFEAELTPVFDETLITINGIYVGGTKLTQDQYTFKDNIVKIAGKYVTGDVIINITAVETQAGPMGIKALSNGNFSVELRENATLPDLKYSTDGENWTTYTKDASVPLTQGQTLLLKGNNPNGWNINYLDPSDDKNVAQIRFSGDYALGGDLGSLIGNQEEITTKVPTYGCFAYMFADQTGLKSISKSFFRHLTTLTPYCYCEMFAGCTGLTDVSKVYIHAKIAYEGCCKSMFINCENLKYAQTILHATEVRASCYEQMFENCTALTNMPELPATHLDGAACYKHMFYNCESLVDIHDLPATNTTKICYGSMFYGCTSLKKAPEMAFTNAADNSCYNMFEECTSLTTPCDLTKVESIGEYAFSGMFSGCSSLTIGHNNPIGQLFFTIPSGGVYGCWGMFDDIDWDYASDGDNFYYEVQ